MTPSARLQTTIELLNLIDTTPRPADAIVSGFFRGHRFIGSKDRASLSERTYGVLRHQARLDWWIQKLKHTPSPRLRFLTYLKLVENTENSAFPELFSGGKFAPEPLNDDEKALLKKLETRTLFHPEMPDTVAGECPDWAAESLKKKFGSTFKSEMDAMLTTAPLDLRINPLKIERDAALEELKKRDIVAQACALSPWGIRIKERLSLSRISLLKDGALEIQDEGSQLVALLMEAQPGERVVDFCAGAGGKTLAIAAMMQNKGRIIACDVLENRLKRSGERFRRAGLHNIETHPLASETDPWVKRHKGLFDRVLVDAPCSGSGTWRRNPDARWKNLGPGLSSLLPLQASILASASRLVKSGGRLVYATCSLLPEENENQIEKFVSEHPDFKVIPVSKIAGKWLGKAYDNAYLSLSPAQHDTDGFFAAVLERTTIKEESA